MENNYSFDGLVQAKSYYSPGISTRLGRLLSSIPACEPSLGENVSIPHTCTYQMRKLDYG